MTKAELVEQMAKDAGISKFAARAALDSFFENITQALQKKDGKLKLQRKMHYPQLRLFP